jgi:hypothetical protein
MVLGLGSASVKECVLAMALGSGYALVLASVLAMA